MPARRPGRLQRIAHDATPLNSSAPDMEARTGWLLAMSRLHHRDSSFIEGRRFLAALTDTGVQASRSLVSRWESGDIPASYEGMAGYEAALGLEAGRITSLSGYIRASMPSLSHRLARPALDPSSSTFTDRFDELLDRVEDGGDRPLDWQELGWYLASAPLVHLRPSTWEALAHRLVALQPRAVKVPYRQYSIAAMNLASVRRAQHYLTEAIAEYVAVADVQVLMNPIGLLDRLPTRKAAALVLDLIDDPPLESVRSLAIWLATQKVHRGDFTSAERTRLDMTVLRMWRADPQTASVELAELVASLPEGVRSTLTHAEQRAGRRRLGYVIEHGEDVVASRAEAISTDVAAGARARAHQEATYEQDLMLPRLIREALFHRDSERRHLAALFIAASPFGDGVTDELLALLRDPSVPSLVRTRLATTARYLSGETHRMRMTQLIEDSDANVAIPITQGLGHLRFSDMSDQALRASLRPAWSQRERAKLYALGMSGSPGLQAMIKSRSTPEWQKGAARWWTSIGPAIRE